MEKKRSCWHHAHDVLHTSVIRRLAGRSVEPSFLPPASWDFFWESPIVGGRQATKGGRQEGADYSWRDPHWWLSSITASLSEWSTKWQKQCNQSEMRPGVCAETLREPLGLHFHLKRAAAFERKAQWKGTGRVNSNRNLREGFRLAALC